MTGVVVSKRIIETQSGDIAGAIVRLAHTENIPRFVMCGRGKGLLSGFLLGSVSEGVIQRSNTDVLIMHFRGSKNPGEAGLEKFCRNVFSHVLCPLTSPGHPKKLLNMQKALAVFGA